MRLWDLLKHDHAEVNRLFSELRQSQGGHRQEELFKKLKRELELHTKVEEEFFYPALMEHDKTRDMAKHAIDEHGEVKELLEELSSLSVGDQKWTEQCREMQQDVEQHVQEEEQDMFPAAQDVLDERKLDEIERQIREAKQAAQAT